MTNFNVELDDVVILVGPNILDHECTMGLPCAIPVTGHLLEPGSSLLVIPGASACGSDSAAAIAQWDASDQTPAVNYVDWDSVAAATSGSAASDQTYDFGTPVQGVPGPSYKICWSHDSLAAADHLVELGVFTLNGPDTAEFTCIIGGQCTLNITGYGFEASNEVVIVYGPFDQINGAGTSGAGCGDGYFMGQAGVMPASLSYGASKFMGDKYTYSIGQAFGAVGDHYKLCWSHDPSATIPAGLPDFKVTVASRFTLAYPVDDGTVWEETSSSSGSESFLGKKRDDSPGMYHDDESGLDFVFTPP
jgi:hypothetical protein